MKQGNDKCDKCKNGSDGVPDCVIDGVCPNSIIELKTLKDLSDNHFCEDITFSEGGLYFREKELRQINNSLRQEAIKYIKQFERDKLNYSNNETIPERYLILCDKIKWIKHFFNIKESDL